MSNLVIVESPTKAKTLKKFLGRSYQVMASQGHLIDLPRSQLGIDIDNAFTPRYITIRGKGKILKELRDARKKARKIFLAADPDREGEAICWHLSQALKLEEGNPCRVEFNEITRSAVQDAFKNPRRIDINRVDAQQARRILDRLVGYQISPLLWRNIRSGLSAGRVQSVAVRLVCEREHEINSFVQREYWSLEALLESNGPNTRFKAALDRCRGKKIEPADHSEVNGVIEAVKHSDFIVSQVVKTRRIRRPSPPFTTSSLQQEASSKMGFASRKTMVLAQQLYEGINIGSGETTGLVTYIRTDSTRVSGEAQAEARSLILERFGADFVPENPPHYRSRKGAQEAHEAIRPTSVRREPDAMLQFLTRDQARLYKLIWDRFVACQMAPAVYDQVRVRVGAGDYTFKASGRSLRFPGFLLIYQGGEEKETILPPLEEGQKLTLVELLPEQHFTQPPPRYNEASLIKTLEEKGIGRPSTYVPIIETIAGRGYVTRENKTFIPTELGFVVVDLMKEFFPEIIDVGFTARMESRLDQIEEGKMACKSVLDDFYGPFRERLAVAEQEIKKIELTAEVSEETCTQCGQNLIIKHGRFGRFLACPGYPECKYTKNIVRETGVECPLDGGMLVERRSKKGRIFYGCGNFPDCRFSVWDRPLKEKCPECGAIMVEVTRRKKPVVRCSNRECPQREHSPVKTIVEG